MKAMVISVDLMMLRFGFDASKMTVQKKKSEKKGLEIGTRTRC
jgi:hypothetical protein